MEDTANLQEYDVCNNAIITNFVRMWKIDYRQENHRSSLWLLVQWYFLILYHYLKIPSPGTVVTRKCIIKHYDD